MHPSIVEIAVHRASGRLSSFVTSARTTRSNVGPGPGPCIGVGPGDPVAVGTGVRADAGTCAEIGIGGGEGIASGMTPANRPEPAPSVCECRQ